MSSWRIGKKLWASSGVDEVFAHSAVVGGCMMFGEIVCEVEVSRCPIHVELVLFDTIPYPIETHVNGAGSSLCDGVVGKADGSGVVN